MPAPTRASGASALLLGGLTLLLSGCLYAPFFATPSLLTGVAASLLEGAGRPRCRGAAELSSDLTPVELSLDTIACMRRGDPRAASLSYALARAYTVFDQLRDPRTAAAQRQGWPGPMLPVLIVRDGLEPKQFDALQREFGMITRQPARRGELCALLRRIGPPSYSLDYSVNERFEVVFPRGRRRDEAGSREALPAGFDRDAVWQKVTRVRGICPPAN